MGNEEHEAVSKKLQQANKDLAFYIEEKENRASELILANKELVFQNDEKEKRAAELIKWSRINFASSARSWNSQFK